MPLGREEVLHKSIARRKVEIEYLDISDAQKDLLTLLDEIAVSREEVMITRDGIGVAKILPCEKTKPEASKYRLRGLPIHIADDFDRPLPQLWSTMNE